MPYAHAHEEPRLADLLRDPVLRLLMAKDRVRVGQILSLIRHRSTWFINKA
jgi:hypothetical protein